MVVQFNKKFEEESFSFSAEKSSDFGFSANKSNDNENYHDE